MFQMFAVRLVCNDTLFRTGIHFVRTGIHFVRLIVAVDLAMAKFVVIPEDPPASAAAVHDQIK